MGLAPTKPKEKQAETTGDLVSTRLKWRISRHQPENEGLDET